MQHNDCCLSGALNYTEALGECAKSLKEVVRTAAGRSRVEAYVQSPNSGGASKGR